MVLGDIKQFAIEYEIKDKVDNWILGVFFFWLNGIQFGNPGDSVDLKGCVCGAERFLKSNIDLVNQEYFNMDPVSLISKIGDLSKVDTKDFKHHVDFIGMSSFDLSSDTFILIKDSNFNERIVYKSEKQGLGETKLKKDEFERVIRMFIDDFKNKFKHEIRDLY